MIGFWVLKTNGFEELQKRSNVEAAKSDLVLDEIKYNI